MSPAVWFITGASSGMGLTMTKLVLSQGDIAIATLRRPEVLEDLKKQYSADHLLVLKLDVSKQSDILDAFNKSYEAFGRIDVVFSNAGFGMLGEVEGTPDEMARSIFETNFWGAMNIAREAVRFFREVNNPIGGRLITISSMLGIVSGAALGFYAASKHALEGGLESFSKELDPKWNIKMTMVEPGGFATRGATPESLVQTPVHPAYSDPKLTVQYIRGYLPNVALPGDTEKAMKVIYHTIAKLDDPPLRLPLGQDALKGFRAQSKAYADDADKWASLSNDLLLEGKEVLTHLD